MFEEETEVAWKVVPREAVVVAGDGTDFGAVDKILGDEDEDMFHGIAVRRGDGETVEVPAGRITKMTMEHIVTDLTQDEVRELPAYRER